MNNILNQNRKVLEKLLPGSNSHVVETKLRSLHYLKMTLYISQLLGKPIAFLLVPCNIR